MKLGVTLFGLAWCDKLQNCHDEDNPCVRETTNGKIQGFAYDPDATYAEDYYVPKAVDQEALINIEYDAEIYMGVPYAQPPVDALRWKPPKKIEENWTNTKEAFKAGPTCSGNDFAEEDGEDCLYLNIYVPKAALRENRKVKLCLIE